jgi:hypothetical protein
MPGKTVSCALNDTGDGSETKFGTLLFGHGPLDGFDFTLDPHEIIAVELIGKRSLNALDQRAAPADKLVAKH